MSVKAYYEGRNLAGWGEIPVNPYPAGTSEAKAFAEGVKDVEGEARLNADTEWD